MMKAVNCPEHGNQVLELARGELGDGPAMQTQQNLETCAHCSTWWSETFSSPQFQSVDSFVAETFTDISLPQKRRRFVWATAAAVILMIAGVSWLNIPSTSSPVHLPVEASIETFDFEAAPPVVDTVDTIQTISFDEPELNLATAHHKDEGASPEQDDSLLFKGGNEEGDLGSWTIHT